MGWLGDWAEGYAERVVNSAEACKALARALQEEMHWLRHQVAARDTMPRVGPIPPRFSPEQAQAMLRIEATFDAIRSLYAHRESLDFLSPPHRHDEPTTFMGVSLYEVHHPIPAPGWRIINPMRRK